MPFPLAHPAAVLPLRGLCPRFLSLSALIIGSLTPDAGYLLAAYQIDELSHRWIGVMGFCMPIGLLALWLFLIFRSHVARHLPDPCRKLLLLIRENSTRPTLKHLVSLMIGAALHLVCDSFTHHDGWVVQHVALLNQPVFRLGHRSLRVCHLLWYGFTFLGVLWLSLAFQRWLHTVHPSRNSDLSYFPLINAIGISSLVVCTGLFHHYSHGLGATVLVAGISFCLVIGFVWWTGNRILHPQ